jgi:Gamma-glutamylcysteine synthetase
MDACSWDQICAQPAFWTGLLYDKDSLEESYSIISDWTDSDRSYLYKNVAKYGLKTKFKGGIILDIAKQFLNISLSGLKKRNNITSTGYDERKYLEPVQENLDKGISPADILIDKYKNKWGKSIIPIYEENIF